MDQLPVKVMAVAWRQKDVFILGGHQPTQSYNDITEVWR